MTEPPPAEPMPVVLRAYAPARHTGGGGAAVEPSEWAVVFDCETTDDTVHTLRFGAFQVRRGGVLHRAGFFYDPDVLPTRGLTLVMETAAADGQEVLELGDFIEDVLYCYGYDLGGLCVGFNLPFDLSRLARWHVTSSSGDAFSFELCSERGRPRVRVAHRNSSSAKIEFVARQSRRPSDHRGHFIDVKTLGKAMTGSGHSLKSLARALGTAHRKIDADHGGELTAQYVRYCANDVQVTWECFEALRERYEGFGLSQTPITTVMSEAGIGKAALREMGIRPWRDVQPDFPPQEIARIMSAYYGGRSEVRQRRTLAEVIYCDFLSMYPTSCANLGLWEYVTAQGIDTYDATAQARALLERVTLDDLQDRQTWRQLAVVVEVAPDADRFPVRAHYDNAPVQPEGRAAPEPAPGIAVNYLTAHERTMHYTLADCIASKLLTGKAPRVVSATGYRPRAPQEGLRPLDAGGNPDYRVDPYTDDYYQRLIELRSEVKHAAGAARAAGTDDLALRLDAQQQGIKISANGSSYGCFIELNPDELPTPTPTAIFSADGPFIATVSRRENPGRYFHPLLATLITGAARLMLALAEHLAYHHQLDWAFCDTDSIAFTNPHDLPTHEFHARVQAIRDWFAPLNPYRTGGDLLKLEDPNYQLDRGHPTDQLGQLLCYAVSPKRYVLFNVDDRWRPILRKASAHGLGHLLPPYPARDAPRNIPPPPVPLRDLGVERWQHDLWYRIAHAALHETDLDLTTLPHLDRPAMASYTVTTPTVERWFDHFNQGRPYRRSTRPFGFFISPTVSALGAPSGKARQRFHLVGPYRTHPDQRARQRYTDIYSGDTFAISPERYDTDTVRVRTYRQIVRSYITHPDRKRLAPGGAPCTRTTTGTLQPRHINAFHHHHIGKETNRLDTTGLPDDPDQPHTHYHDPRHDPFTTWVLPILRDIGPTRVAREAGLTPRAIAKLLGGQSQRPHPRTRTRLTRIAERHAARQLVALGTSIPQDRLARMYTWLCALDHSAASRYCDMCGTALGTANARIRYCSDACRQRAYRQKTRRDTASRERSRRHTGRLRP